MRWTKVILKITGSIVAVLLILFLGIVIYVNANKTAVFKLLTTQLQANINGTLTIRDMKPTLFRGFPAISILLEDVTLRDSLWEQYHNTLLAAKEVYVSINALALLKGEARIRDIHIKDGRVFLFTDSTGYSNTKIFFGQSNDETIKKKDFPHIAHIYFTDMEVIVENKPHFKYFDFDIKKLEAKVDFTNAGWNTNVYLKTLVKNMMFDTEKGSFLKNKLVTADLDLSYDKRKEIVSMPWQKVKVNKDELKVKGEFSFVQKPIAFVLYVNADKMLYQDALTSLTPFISKQMKDYGLLKPVSGQVMLAGTTKAKDIPHVIASWQVHNNTFSTPYGPIYNCSYNGTFDNEKAKGSPRKDWNTIVAINDMAGVWMGIPFHADTVSISNLDNPVLEGRFISKFEVTRLNPIIGGNTFRFDKGTANMNIHYKGGIYRNDTTDPYIIGSLKLIDAAMTYVPRGLTFTNCSATLRFAGSDLFINKVKAQAGTTKLDMDGSLMNVLNLYYKAPDKILLDWHVHSPQIDVAEFIPFLAPRKTTDTGASVKDVKLNKMSGQLNKMLALSSVHMRVNADKVVYRRFEGQQLNGDVTMTNSGIAIKDLNIKHADGTVRTSVTLQQQDAINSYALTADVAHVNVKKFFAAFENFGQTAITDNNINGNLSANIDITGALKENGKLVPHAINGTASFKFENGSLVNFDAFRTIGKLLFRKRNLDSITFREIDNKFNIQGDRIIINPIFIESSALNMHVEGTYAIKGPGTDINMDIPLRNPDKDELILNDDLRFERNMKGLVVHLKAANGDDGKVKIKWNRGRKAPGTDTPAEDSPTEKRKRKREKK